MLREVGWLDQRLVVVMRGGYSARFAELHLRSVEGCRTGLRLPGVERDAGAELTQWAIKITHLHELLPGNWKPNSEWAG